MDEEIESDVYMAALNAALVFLTYAFVVIGAGMFLKYSHGIDLLDIMGEGLTGGLSYFGAVVSFLDFLVEHVLVTAFLLSLMYAAYIANYKVEIEDGRLKYRKGLLVVKEEEIDIDNVEQVYTEDYPFFYETKALCIKALDAEPLEVPYVRNAEHFKDELVGLVKERHHEFEIEEMLESPIRAKPVAGGV